VRGTIVKKSNGRYYVATHHVDDTGRRVQRSHGGFKTKREAEQKLTEVLRSVDQGRFVAPSRRRLGEFLSDEWLPTVQVSGLRPGTFRSYKGLVERYIIPRLGQVALQALTPVIVTIFYKELLESGRSGGRGGLAPKTVRETHMVLRKAMADAVRWGYVMAPNPVDGASPPKTGYRRRISTWTPAQVKTFLTSVEDDRLFPMWMVAASTGMRRGEILGLAWDSVDLGAARLAVRQALVNGPSGPELQPPKTRKSVRVVPLDEKTVEALRRWRDLRTTEMSVAGRHLTEDDLVFTTPLGVPLRPDSMLPMFRRRSRSAGLPRIRFHDLRHTFATNALRAGVAPKVVSDILGHSSIAFTLDIYTHAVPVMQEDAVARVANLVWDAEPETVITSGETPANGG